MNGVASFRDRGEDAFYSAEASVEARTTPTGQEYQVTVYRNMTRP